MMTEFEQVYQVAMHRLSKAGECYERLELGQMINDLTAARDALSHLLKCQKGARRNEL